jgi:hypothetical protein
MSDLSAAAAAALGVPESIVLRSAAARAAETGMTVDEVLTAWAGGGTIAGAPSAADTPAPEASPEPAETSTEPVIVDDAPSPAAAPTVEPARAAAAMTPSEAAPTTVSGKPPVLVGKTDNPMAVMVGAVALFAAIFLVGLVGPALPAENPGARTSELGFSEAGERGRHVFQTVGCFACHTQLVRPVVSDVGLGAVTLNDSNQVLGTRRFGPDLSDVGTRLSVSQIEAVITGLGDHPGLSLSQDDLDDLATYLLESQTSVEETDDPVSPSEDTETGEGEEG